MKCVVTDEGWISSWCKISLTRQLYNFAWFHSIIPDTKGKGRTHDIVRQVEIHLNEKRGNSSQSNKRGALGHCPLGPWVNPPLMVLQ